MKKQCKTCNTPFRGRPDKKFCSLQCKNRWYRNQQKINKRITAPIDAILHQNRKVIQQLQPPEALKWKVRKEELIQLGFQFGYCTNIYTTAKGTTYRILYEYAWLDISPHEILLVQRKK